RGHGMDHRAELVGHALFADEERGQAVHATKALLFGEPFPVRAVPLEVDVLGPPLLAFPKLVELLVAEELRLSPVRRLLNRRIGRIPKEVALLDADGRAHACSLCALPRTAASRR